MKIPPKVKVEIVECLEFWIWFNIDQRRAVLMDNGGESDMPVTAFDEWKEDELRRLAAKREAAMRALSWVKSQEVERGQGHE